MSDYIIIANGPFLKREIIEEAIQNKIIIALDGAANKLVQFNIKPNVILGDLDSIQNSQENIWGIKKTFTELNENEEPYLGNCDVTIVPIKNQELTDLAKGIRYCDQQGASSITIICASGGRLDHHEGVMMAMRSEYKKNRNLILHTEQQTLCFAKDETIIISGEVGDKCGVIATHIGTFCSKGLKYEGSNHTESISNELIHTTASISVIGGALIIMPPQLVSQREFVKKNG